MKEEPNVAYWSISLDVECPGCHEMVDLLDDPDILCDSNFELAEHGTSGTTDVEVFCPNCGHKFKCDFEY